MATLSVVIVTRNEERNIGACLESVQWADEIIVIDMFSTDKTVEIARRFTQKIYFDGHYLNDMRKNLGFDKAACEWVLNVDADELISPELCREIKETIDSGPQHDGYFIPFKHYYMNRWMKYGGWYPSYIIRLLRKGKGRYVKEDEHNLVRIQGTVGYLKNPVIHKGFGNPVSFARKHNLYSSNIARAAFQRGEKVSLRMLFVRPPYIFCKRFLFQKGFLDGIPGLILMTEFVFFLFLEQVKLWKLYRDDKKTSTAGKPA